MQTEKNKMETKTLKQYEGKKCRVILKIGFSELIYHCSIVKVHDDGHFEIIDRYGDAFVHDAKNVTSITLPKWGAEQ